jgi:hypothetical protein
MMIQTRGLSRKGAKTLSSEYEKKEILLCELGVLAGEKSEE